MRSRSLATLLAAAIALAACSQAPGPAPAQNAAAPPSGSAAVTGLGQRPPEVAGADPAAYSQWLAAQALSAELRNARGPCPAATVSSLGGAVEAGAPIVQAPPPGQFINTTYIEHLQVQGCGRADRINILVLRLTTGAWTPYRMLDGDSHTGPQLQHDALQTAAAAFAAGAHCASDQQAQSTLNIGPARFLEGSTTGGPWQELWTASDCGQTVNVKLTFTPDVGDPGADFSAAVMPANGSGAGAAAP